jgi:hypothetical protein
MKYTLTIIALLSSLAWATNPPANLTGIEVTDQTNLEAKLTWNVVPGATYSVYRYKDYACSPTVKWEEIAPALTVATYTDIPNSGKLGNLGPWCYTVTATVGGVESAKSNIVNVHLGNHWYWYVKYRLPDCVTKVATPAGSSLSITQLRNGVLTSISVSMLGTDAFYGTSRFYDDAVYSAALTLPSGKIINYPAQIFGTGQPISAATGSYWHTSFIQGSDKWCYYDQSNAFQPASSN